MEESKPLQLIKQQQVKEELEELKSDNQWIYRLLYDDVREQKCFKGHNRSKRREKLREDEVIFGK